LGIGVDLFVGGVLRRAGEAGLGVMGLWVDWQVYFLVIAHIIFNYLFISFLDMLKNPPVLLYRLVSTIFIVI
jgi:hypothetical protein